MDKFFDIDHIAFKREFGLMIIGGIIFTISFIWHDYFKDIQEMFFPIQKGLLARTIYMIIITALFVFIAMKLRPFFGLSSTTKDHEIDPLLKFGDNLNKRRIRNTNSEETNFNR
ncbi:MAG: hypothetical protein Hyperionvirus32_7 [Hyperionvirus sp.]|uniref:Uncharacterized protein n=1 Tax=Hyperionvirus sp. TaxID=2487770 RepID=A0A3G5ABR6_9VIRU|nr:MAG: hypothetical protein Hyperionvirus32_7 [Hyperionvirus sp.]